MNSGLSYLPLLIQESKVCSLRDREQGYVGIRRILTEAVHSSASIRAERHKERWQKRSDYKLINNAINHFFNPWDEKLKETL